MTKEDLEIVKDAIARVEHASNVYNLAKGDAEQVDSLEWKRIKRDLEYAHRNLGRHWKSIRALIEYD